jgi:signal peptidase II
VQEWEVAVVESNLEHKRAAQGAESTPLGPASSSASKFHRPDPSKGPWRLLVAPLVAAAVVLADVASTSWALHALSKHPIKVLGPLQFRLAFNTGAAFSLARGMTGLLVAIAVIVIIAMVVALRRSTRLSTSIALGLILGGAIGNLGERLFRSDHAVVDFIYTRYWPTFNVADSCIVIGVVWLIVAMLLQDRRGSRHSRARAAAVAKAPGDQPSDQGSTVAPGCSQGADLVVEVKDAARDRP